MSHVRLVLNIIKQILKSSKITLLFYNFLLPLKNIGIKKENSVIAFSSTF